MTEKIPDLDAAMRLMVASAVWRLSDDHDRHPPLNLPQLAELKIPRPVDVAGGFLLYDRFMKRVYLADSDYHLPVI